MTMIPTDEGSNARDERTRVHVRMSESLKAQIFEAATLCYVKPAEFIRQVLAEKSRQVVREAHVIDLSKRDTIRFFEALEQGVEPSETLLREAEEYRREVVEGRLDSR